MRLLVFSKAGVIKKQNFARVCVGGVLQDLPNHILDTHKWVML